MSLSCLSSLLICRFHLYVFSLLLFICLYVFVCLSMSPLVFLFVWFVKFCFPINRSSVEMFIIFILMFVTIFLYLFVCLFVFFYICLYICLLFLFSLYYFSSLMFFCVPVHLYTHIPVYLYDCMKKDNENNSKRKKEDEAHDLYRLLSCPQVRYRFHK